MASVHFPYFWFQKNNNKKFNYFYSRSLCYFLELYRSISIEFNTNKSIFIERGIRSTRISCCRTGSRKYIL